MVLKSGFLLKWTNIVKGYQQRWFVLDEINGLLSYYTSPEKLIRGDRRGCIRLRGALLGIEEYENTTFSISLDGKDFHFKAQTLQERDDWVASLAEVIHLSRKRPKSRKSLPGITEERVFVPLHKRNIKEFNRKLIETDSFLQILIKQTQNLDKKISEDFKLEYGPDPSLKESELNNNNEQLKDLRTLCGYYLDSIKHTIFLLQVAKARQNHEAKLNEIDDYSLTQKEPISRSENIDIKIIDPSETDPTITTLQATSALEAFSNLNEQYNKANHNFQENSKVPDISYESSDDDDDDDDNEESNDESDYFFDANDQQFSDFEDAPSILNSITTMPISKKVTKSSPRSLTSNQSSSQTSCLPQEIDWDKLYDSDEESDIPPVTAHTTVISHLLSQVRIGMDLTKVTLPTFILERRSLLEMYADFFAHADIFVSVRNYETPQERMIQVVRWYLSAFHAGRKGSVAKKPYNPILGEVFKCYWDLSSDVEEPEYSTDTPVPWAKTSDLLFVAEQVSHHPPISAFYAESADKKVMCSAQIYTKSKFLGLHIGVDNIGKGSLYLLDLNEEYTCTFPSAYGRYIITEPWFELAGNVHIECPQTGYTAKVEFIAKPFYGGKRHRIHANIYDPNKKVIVAISGEWNGKMEAKWMNPNSGGTMKKELFIDTKSLPVVKKIVKPISEQEEYESRNVWKKVTWALKRQDVNLATEAKSEVEQQQRNLVKEREEKRIKWQNRFFHNLGEKWLYNSPLTQRKPKR